MIEFFQEWGFTVGGLVLVLVLLRLLKSVRSSSASGGSGSSSSRGQYSSKESRKTLRRKAQRLREQGRLTEAGDLFAEAGDDDTALMAYMEAGARVQAARILEKYRDFEAAATAYEAGLDFLAAAKAAARGGDHIRAADNYLKANQKEEAAKCFARAGDGARSGNLYWELGDLVKAAEAYQKAGLFEEAGQAYRALVMQKETGREGNAPAERPKSLIARCARCFLAAGNAKAAAEVHLTVGDFHEAASIYQTAGMLAEAAQALKDGGRLGEAADLLESAGQRDEAARLRAREAAEAGDYETAARQFEIGGMVHQAAEYYVRAGNHARAARLLESCGAWNEAGRAWEAARDATAAARAYERGDVVAKAAELYRQAGDVASELRLRLRSGDNLRAAQLLLDSGDKEEAEKILKRVAPQHQAYRQACLLLGNIYKGDGRFDAATVKLRQALSGLRPSQTNIGIFYDLGDCACNVEDRDTAKAAFGAIYELDPTYRDVADRLAGLKKKEEAAQQRISGDSRNRDGVATAGGKGGRGGAGAFGGKDVDLTMPLPSDGRYRVLEVLGRGGSAVVYRARDRVLGRDVALKVLSAASSDGITARDYFLREARSAASLNHPYIVTVYDLGEESGSLYIAMELIEGTTLRKLVRAQGTLGLPFLKKVACQACDALAYAHEHRIIHRDIKPANLMWSGAGHLKVTDFGLAKLMQEGNFDASGSHIIGTPYYMAPEQILGGPVDVRTDIYSLGVTLFELATGQVPFRTGNVPRHHLVTPAPSPRLLRPDIPIALEAAILKCMAKERDARFPDVLALKDALEGVGTPC